MIGEYSRGPTIECALTRSRILNPGMRIIALSATLKNMSELSSWLDAHVVQHDYRPVPLYKDVLTTEELELRNKNDVIVRVLNTSIEESSQILVFVSTRRFTESLAKYVAGKVKRKISLQGRRFSRRLQRRYLTCPGRGGHSRLRCALSLQNALKME